MSIANQKGGFFRTLEINRDSAADSATTLIEPILKQAQNYIVQVQRFVTNFTPPINTFTTPMFTVRSKGVVSDEGNTVFFAHNAQSLEVAGQTAFTPTFIHTTTELVRQIIAFFQNVDGVTATPTPGLQVSLSITKEFGRLQYIEVGESYRSLLGLPKYIIYFRGKETYNPEAPLTGTELVLTESKYLFRRVDELADDEKVAEEHYYRPTLAFKAEDPEHHAVVSGTSLLLCDTRQFIDITFTMPHISQLTILDGTEERKKLLARFPLRDFENTEHVSGEGYRSYGVRETVTLGQEDLCRKNPNVHTMLLLPGEVQHANIRIETTYLESKKFKTIPANFGPSGFWSLKLLLAKKIK